MWHQNNSTLGGGNIILPAYVFVCTGLILIALANSFVKPLGLYDEGFSLTNALRMLYGEIPHKDIWAAYPPGTSLTIAAFFYIFEPNLFVARIVNLGWTILILIAIFSLLRHFASFWLSITAVTFASFWISASLYPSYSVTPALALIFTALTLLVKGIESRNSKTTTLGGFVAGLVVLYRHDFAGYLFISVTLALLYDALRQKHDKNTTTAGMSALVFIVAFLSTALVLISTLLVVSGYENFVEQAIVFPATVMRENRLLPYPGFFDFVSGWSVRWLLAWLAPLMFVIGISIQLVTRANQGIANTITTNTLALMSLLLTIQAHNRLDMPHAAPSMIFTLCFLAMLTTGKPQAMPKTYTITSYGIIVVFLAYTLYIAHKHIDYKNVFKCALDNRAHTCMNISHQQAEVVKYINLKYGPDEYVFVGNTRHDKIFVNDASLYFLLKRPIPIRWNEMHPGVVTTREVQETIIRQLEEKRVKIIVLADMPEPRENNASSVSSGIHVLDDYIKNNYKPIFYNSKYQVLERESPVSQSR